MRNLRQSCDSHHSGGFEFVDSAAMVTHTTKTIRIKTWLLQNDVPDDATNRQTDQKTGFIAY